MTVLNLARGVNGSHWASVWAALPEGHANQSEARERTLDSYDFMGSEAAFRELINHPEHFNVLFEKGLEYAGRDRYNLGYLVNSMCKVGDFQRANMTRMKIAKSGRSMANESMILPLMAAGELT